MNNSIWGCHNCGNTFEGMLLHCPHCGQNQHKKATSINSKGREYEIKFRTLLEILNNKLSTEQYCEILQQLDDEATPKLEVEHEKIKQYRKERDNEIKRLDEKIKNDRMGRGTDW